MLVVSFLLFILSFVVYLLPSNNQLIYWLSIFNVGFWGSAFLIELVKALYSNIKLGSFNYRSKNYYWALRLPKQAPLYSERNGVHTKVYHLWFGLRITKRVRDA